MMKDGYKKAILIGHSSDDSSEIINLFYNSGAKLFLKKPPFFKDIQKIVSDSH